MFLWLTFYKYVIYKYRDIKVRVIKYVYRILLYRNLSIDFFFNIIEEIIVFYCRSIKQILNIIEEIYKDNN